jgi:predicted CXXCH cytochrome family protein
MSKSTTLFLVASTLLGSVVGLAFADIEGSKHDFRAQREGEADLCLPCHTAHETTAPAAIPLWNPSADPQQRYVLYGGAAGTLDRGSLMCLSCHDGSTANDTIGGVQWQDTRAQRIVGMGHDLSQDHPVGVAYPQNRAGYKPKAKVESDGVIPLPAGNVGCTSCHDAHSPLNDRYMLVKSNDRSRLCLSCHEK